MNAFQSVAKCFEPFSFGSKSSNFNNIKEGGNLFGAGTEEAAREGNASDGAKTGSAGACGSLGAAVTGKLRQRRTVNYGSPSLACEHRRKNFLTLSYLTSLGHRSSTNITPLLQNSTGTRAPSQACWSSLFHFCVCEVRAKKTCQRAYACFLSSLVGMRYGRLGRELGSCASAQQQVPA